MFKIPCVLFIYLPVSCVLLSVRLRPCEMTMPLCFTCRVSGCAATLLSVFCLGLLYKGPECAYSSTTDTEFDVGWPDGSSAPSWSGGPLSPEYDAGFTGNFEEIGEAREQRRSMPSFLGPQFGVDDAWLGEEQNNRRSSTTTTATTATKSTTATTTRRLFSHFHRYPHRPSTFSPGGSLWDGLDILLPEDLLLGVDVRTATTTTTTSTPTTTTTTTATTATTTSTEGIPLDPRYHTEIVEVEEPTSEDRQRCRLTLPVSTISRGECSYLLRGDWVVSLENEKTVTVYALSEKEEAPPTWFLSRAWRSLRNFFSAPHSFYMFPVPLPEKCIYRPNDPASGSAAVEEPEKVTQIVVQLTPDARATFLPSLSFPPITPLFASFGRGRFKRLGMCLYGMEIVHPVEVESLIFTSSALTAVVEARDPNGGPNLQLETLQIPCSCSPERLGLISWWTGRGIFGTPFVLFYVGYDGDDPHRPPDKCKKQRLHKVPLANLETPVNYAETPFYRKI